jgi:hypothetical protein
MCRLQYFVTTLFLDAPLTRSIHLGSLKQFKKHTNELVNLFQCATQWEAQGCQLLFSGFLFIFATVPRRPAHALLWLHRLPSPLGITSEAISQHDLATPIAEVVVVESHVEDVDDGKSHICLQNLPSVKCPQDGNHTPKLVHSLLLSIL